MMLQHRTGFCVICGRGTQGTDLHHVVYRSAQGSNEPENILELDRQCHDAIHRGDWKITEYSDSKLLVMAGNEVVVEREYNPQFDQGHYLEGWRVLADAVADGRAQVQFLDDEGLKATHEATERMAMELWLTRVKTIAIAMLHTPYGQRGEKMQAVTAELGISRSRGHDLYRVHKEFGSDLSTYLDIPLEPSFIIEAAKAENPQAALEIAVDMKTQEPRTTVQQFRKALKGDDTCSWRDGELCKLAQYQHCETCPQVWGIMDVRRK